MGKEKVSLNDYQKNVLIVFWNYKKEVDNIDIYGKTYKKLRKKYGLTLSETSSEIVDAATLSRWENGKGEMYFGIVVDWSRRYLTRKT